MTIMIVTLSIIITTDTVPPIPSSFLARQNNMATNTTMANTTVTIISVNAIVVSIDVSVKNNIAFAITTITASSSIITMHTPSGLPLRIKTLAPFRQHHFHHNLHDHHHTHVQTRTHSDFVNFIPQLEQAFAAYSKDTSKLTALQQAFETATDAGCTDTTAYKTVKHLLQANQTLCFASIFSAIICVTITMIIFTRAPTLISLTLFHSWSKHLLRIARIPPS